MHPDVSVSSSQRPEEAARALLHGARPILSSMFAGIRYYTFIVNIRGLRRTPLGGQGAGGTDKGAAAAAATRTRCARRCCR